MVCPAPPAPGVRLYEEVVLASMRALLQLRLLRLSGPLGLGLAAAAAPLVLAATADRTLRALQLQALPVLCVLLMQAALAWTPSEARRWPGRRDDPEAGRWLSLLLLAVAVTALRIGSDRWLERLVAIPAIADWRAFALKLPFAALVQPLFLVIGVYAFSLRLGRQRHLALAAVTLMHELVVVLQFGRVLDPVPLAGLVGLAGLHGLLGAVAYARYGFAGPIALATLSFCRHAGYLLLAA